MTIDWAISRGARDLGRHPFAARKRNTLPLGPAIEVAHVSFPYRPWDGEIGPWSEHFGKGWKQMYSLDSQPVDGDFAPKIGCRVGNVRFQPIHVRYGSQTHLSIRTY